MTYVLVWRALFTKVFQKSPRELLFLAIMALGQACMVIVQMIVLENFLDHVNNTDSGFSHFFLLLFAAIIANRFLNGFFNYSVNMFIKKIQKTTEVIFIEKMLRIPLESFYDVDFEVRKSQAKQGAKTAPLFLMISLMIVFFNIPFFILFSIYLARQYPLLLVCTLIAILSGIFAEVKNRKQFGILEDSIAVSRREAEYYLSCIADKEYFKETRLFNGFGYFRRKYKESASQFAVQSYKTEKKAFFNTIISQGAKMLAYILILLLLLYSLANHFISLGVFGAIITALTNLFTLIDDTVHRDIGNLSHFYANIKSYVEFIDSETEEQKSDIDLPQEIEFRNISYTYPHENRAALDGLSLCVKKGQTLAIVGENGSGKTTFSKIILGLINPREGKIFANGHEIKLNAGRVSGLSAAFQDYQRYELMLRENVCISDVSKNIVDQTVHKILDRFGIFCDDRKTFARGLETVLSRSFDGTDISNGQWQRIALARAQYRESSVIVLDEPTSAIDPLEESALYTQFAQMCENKTGIMITHRLGLARVADRIAVFDKGRVTEIGSHNELMTLHGKYFDMYTKQSALYLRCEF